MTHPRVPSKRGPSAAHTRLVFGWHLKFSLVNVETALKKAQNIDGYADDMAQTATFRSSQLRDSSEKGFRVSPLVNWRTLCLNWQICEVTESPNGENVNLGKPASLLSQKMNPQSRCGHSRGNMCWKRRRKMCHGRILTDSAQDNVQIDAKLNATEQGNTYPSSEKNSQ